MDANMVSRESRVLFVNDGSKDRTWEIISALHEASSLFCGVDLSRNRGHQNALLAGLMIAKDRADMVISMDADLQDDVDAVDRMVEKYLEGTDIVYGVRASRKKDTFFKKFTAEGFYRLMNVLGAETVFNHADYRLMSRRALEGLEEFGEVNLFLRGIVPMIGYRTDTVEYERGERFAGESKYPLKKDDPVCHRRDHFAVRQTPSDDHGYRIFYFHYFALYDRIQHFPLGSRRHGDRLGQSVVFGVVDRWACPSVAGCHRGICGQDLSGKQEPPKIPDPRDAGGSGLTCSAVEIRQNISTVWVLIENHAERLQIFWKKIKVSVSEKIKCNRFCNQ